MPRVAKKPSDFATCTYSTPAAVPLAMTDSRSPDVSFSRSQVPEPVER